MWFLGIDWGEHHHDLCLLDQDGRVLAARRIADGLAGAGELHQLVAAHAEQPGQVAVGIETDRGLLVAALLAAGYQVYAVNPQVVSHYRGRHGSSRAKSDRSDAKVLADLSAPTGTTTARSPGTARWPRPSRCWPGRTRA
jgi:transposase